MRIQKKDPANKMVKEAKKTSANFTMLPLDTTIDVVAVTTDKTYIFEMSFGKWLRIERKPGVRYSAFQKGFAQFPEAVRTEYKN